MSETVTFFFWRVNGVFSLLQQEQMEAIVWTSSAWRAEFFGPRLIQFVHTKHAIKAVITL
jgi:hypothetical protein